MADNLVDLVRSFLDKGPLDSISRFVGEDRDGTRRALEAAGPASIVGVADYASNEGNAASLLDRFRRGEFPSVDAGDIDNVTRNPLRSAEMVRGGEGMLQHVFGGNRTADLIGGISGHSGLSRTGVGRILALAMPIVLGAIGKRAAAQNMDARGLSKYLGTQRGLAAAMLPASLGSTFGHVPHAKVSRLGPKPASRRILPWAFAALAAVLAISLIARRSQRSERPSAERHTSRQTERPIARHYPETKERPAQGTNQGIEAVGAALGGDAAKISHYLASDATQPQRFELSGVEFETGSATLDPSDRQALGNIAQVLTKDEKASVRIEGHADPAGDEMMNQRLSQLRAQEVERFLVSKNVSEDRLSVAGKGEREKTGQSDEARRSVDLVVERR